jgi:hypothetical protein
MLQYGRAFKFIMPRYPPLDPLSFLMPILFYHFCTFPSGPFKFNIFVVWYDREVAGDDAAAL